MTVQNYSVLWQQCGSRNRLP